MSAPEPAFRSRGVDKIVLSVAQAEGNGMMIRRSIGRPELPYFSPFLMLDEAKAALPLGAPDHPHRGFATVSFGLPHSVGAIVHEDFLGHAGRIGPGDVQWMTAGRGIMHSEMPASAEPAHGLQLWVNLPASAKMVEPSYQEHTAAEIPMVERDGVTARVIAGSALGAESPIRTHTPVNYIHFEMQPGSVLRQPIGRGWNAFVYTIRGRGTYCGAAVDAHHTVAMTRGDDLDGAEVRADGGGPIEFVMISGEPIDEPISRYGPFVMNTPDEIRQAFEDFRGGKNGFENAPGWRSKAGNAS